MIWIYACLFFFSLSFKKCNKLDKYIFTYFFIIPIIPLYNFFNNKDRLNFINLYLNFINPKLAKRQI